MNLVLTLLGLLVALAGVCSAWLGIRAIVANDHRAGFTGVITITSTKTGALAFLLGCVLLAFFLVVLGLTVH